MIPAFSFASTPLLHVGPGKISILPSLIRGFGSRVALITGAQSFMSSRRGDLVLESLRTHGITFTHYVIDKEPTPGMIDSAVAALAQHAPDVVVAIGGGSVLDA